MKPGNFKCASKGMESYKVSQLGASSAFTRTEKVPGFVIPLFNIWGSTYIGVKGKIVPNLYGGDMFYIPVQVPKSVSSR